MDKDSLNRLRSGEAQAFRELVETYRDKVISTCFRFLGNREDAEETALDVFMEVHRSLSSFREEAELSTWIFRIAVTKSLDLLRKKKRKKRFDALRGARAPAVEMEGLPAPEGADPERALEIEARSRILQEAIDGLHENQKVAITLSRIEGLESKKITEILGTTTPAVDALIHRAKKNLRKKLAEHYIKASKREPKNEP
jgi:RNA polymerase sigma-70 factor (ECF subfamily)